MNGEGVPDDIGVRVWRYEYTDTPSGARGYMYEDSPNRDPYDVDPADPGLEPGRWFPEAHAAALVDVAEALRVARGHYPHQKPWGRVWEALARLDAAKAGGS